MNAQEVLARIEADQGDLEDHYVLCSALRAQLSAGQIDQLRQLVQTGPCWDGDVISKTARDSLLSLRLAVRCVMKGEVGYTAATYLGRRVLLSEALQ